MENGRLPSSVRSEKAKLVYAHILTKAPDLVMYGSGEKGWKRRRLRNWVQSFSNPTAHSKRSRVIPTIIWILTVWICFEWIADSTSEKRPRTGKGKERLRTKWAWRCFIFLRPRVKRESASEGSKRRIVYFLSYLEKRRNCALGLNTSGPYFFPSWLELLQFSRPCQFSFGPESLKDFPCVVRVRTFLESFINYSFHAEIMPTSYHVSKEKKECNCFLPFLHGSEMERKIRMKLRIAKINCIWASWEQHTHCCRMVVWHRVTVFCLQTDHFRSVG